MANEINCQIQISPEKNDATLTSENPTLLHNEMCIAYDTGQMAVGPGTWNARKGLYFDFANKQIYISVATGAAVIKAITAAAANAEIFLTNSVGTWRMQNGSTGNFQLYDSTNVKIPIVFEPDCPTNLIKGFAVGRLDFGGATATGSGGRLTIVAGTYNDLNVSDTRLIFADTSSGDITLNGFTNGVLGAELRIIKTSASNNLIYTNNSGSGTQKIYVEAAAGTVIKSTLGSNTLVFSTLGTWQLDE